MIIAVVLDGEDHPICLEMWPGNTADVTRLVPVVDRLTRRFAIGRICIAGPRESVGRGIISAATLAYSPQCVPANFCALISMASSKVAGRTAL